MKRQAGLYLWQKESGTSIVQDLWLAATFWRRLKGLLGTKELLPGQGLLLRPCNSVHTIGMAYSLDVIFLSHNFQVLQVVESLRPRRFACHFAAHQVLELPSGTIASCGIAPGQALELGFFDGNTEVT